MNFHNSNRGEDPSEWLLDVGVVEKEPGRDSLVVRSGEAEWCIKAHKNRKSSGRFEPSFNEICDRCIEDGSIGIHYSLCEDITGLRTLEELGGRLYPDGAHRCALRQIHNFVNELKKGDTIIIGQGNCDGRDGKRLLIATIASDAYFDRGDMWKYDKGGVEGFYTRRKIIDIVELPEGSRLENLKMKIHTLTKQERGSFGVVLGGV